MNVVHSTTPKGEKPTDNSLKTCWKNFNWQIAQEYVNRLQSRITKATLKQNWNLVKRLQHLLTNSFSAKMIATQTVSKNKGKRTAGIDGIIWTTPETKMAAALSLSSKKLQSPAITASVYWQIWEEREATPEYPNYAWPRDTGSLCTRIKPCRRSNCGQTFFWLQEISKHTGRMRADLYQSMPRLLSTMDTRRRYQRVFR